MGYTYAAGLAAHTDLRTAISLHLSSNFYPPLPQGYVQPAIEAIEAYLDALPDLDVVTEPIDLDPTLNPMPRLARVTDDGVTISVASLISVLRLEAFIDTLTDDLDEEI